ncbi:MAG: hypothetical protein ACRD29_24200 [Acidimicrobiales bacterium]
MRVARLRHDEGATLAFTLVFVLVVGLLVSAMLSQAYTGFRTTQVVRNTADKVYAVDAGIEHGIETFRNNPWMCPEPGDTFSYPMQVDGRAVVVTCENRWGSSLGAAGWTVITTGDSGPSLTTQGEATTISGPVFATEVSEQLKLFVDGGPLIEQGIDFDCHNPENVSGIPDPPFGYECLNMDVPGPEVGPPDPPGDDGQWTPGGPDCTIFLPGLYAAPPPLTGINYFVSGLYYFEFPDNQAWTVDGQAIVAGAPPDEAGACGYGSDDGQGVTFVFDENSRMVVADEAAVELWAPPGDADQGIGAISILSAGEATDGSNAILTVVPSSGSSFVVHGLLYAPDRVVNLSGEGSVVEAFGGVVARRLELHDVLEIALQGSGVRRVWIDATTAGTEPNERPASARAVVELHNNEARTVTIVSWRNRLDPSSEQ